MTLAKMAMPLALCQSDLMTAARLFLTHCLIWLLTLASPAGAGHLVVADLQGGIAQSVFAGLQEGAPEQQPGQSDEEYYAVNNASKTDIEGQANLLDAVADYATFGGQVADFTNAATTAQGKEEFSVIFPGMMSSACSYTDQ